MDPVRTQARLSRCAILFVDLRGYTTLCEDLAPSEAVHLLDEFYGVISQSVAGFGGEVHNLSGDAVMAVFGLSTPTPGGDGRAAVESGRRMIEAFQPMGMRWETVHGVATGIGVGVHLGVVAESELGPPHLRRVTLVGDTVNVAARLCHRARAGEVLFSSEVATQLGDGDRQDIIALPNFSLRGRAAPVRIYCVPAPERMDPMAPSGHLI
jgi:adenylate cyclase